MFTAIYYTLQHQKDPGVNVLCEVVFVLENVCIGVCVFMCASLQISKSKHKGTKEWKDGFINSGTFDLCRTSLNGSQGLILADLHQILSLNILHTLWKSFIYVTLPLHLWHRISSSSSHPSPTLSVIVIAPPLVLKLYMMVALIGA